MSGLNNTMLNQHKLKQIFNRVKIKLLALGSHLPKFSK